MTRILLVIPTLTAGGAERILSQLANHWAAEGYEISFALLGGGESFYPLDAEIKIHDMSHQRVKNVSKILSLPATFFSLRALVKRTEPDVILSFLERFNMFTLSATKGLNVPICVADRNDPTRGLPPHLYWLKKKTYSWSSAVVVQTMIAKGILVDLLPQDHKLEVIPNFIRDVAEYSNVERENLIVNVGRLCEQKNQASLIRSFAKLKNKKWRLCILGEGPKRADLEALAATLGVADRLQMPGAVKNVDEYLARASIFAFSSKFEGFPNALCEAMASGLACVSTNCNTGPAEVIQDEVNGYLVPVKGVSEMTQRLDALSESLELRSKVGRNAKKIKERLAIGSIANEWMLVLNEIVKVKL
jgi:GalNAc-alpha-(1->4)-GalNAc-alpha-(1->3)-diNAcBac-PP-undecaprenol alpha-1,4-N-acetyl-D-galactosaminyltransferase